MLTASLRALALLAFVGLVGYGLWTSHGVSDGRWLVLLGAAWVCLLVGVWTKLPRSWPVYNRTVVRTALVITTVFAIVGVQLVRIQIVASNDTANRVASEDGEIFANPRLQTSSLDVKRGRIFDRNGTVLANTVADGDAWRRVYPDPASSYLMGYDSPLIYGTAGLEATYDAQLSGESGNNPFVRWENRLLHRPQEGLDLHLTLDDALQQRAQDLLDGRPGAVILLDVKTGAVLAMASAPTFDPNRLFTASPAEHDAGVAYWSELTADPARPLVERATGGLYPPGSTFKTVTGSAAIDSGLSNPDKTYTDDGSLDVQGHVIPENNRPDDTVDTWTLRQGLAWSLNVVFAQVGLELGPDRLREYAERFGIGAAIPFDLPVARGQLASTPNYLDSVPALADTAFGQGQLLVTPLQMALVAEAIANGGTMMQPYLVDRLTTQGGRTTERHAPQTWRKPISTKTAATMRDMMINAVNNGWASDAAIPGLVVGGKTGTAETGGNQDPHGWFIGFVGDPTPRYVVAVVLEHGGEGTRTALPIGRAMLQAAMASGD